MSGHSSTRESDYERACARVNRLDPTIVEAVEDVDRSLLRWMLSLSPRERLEACTKTTRGLARIRRATS